jgi:hypothetical protein
MFAKAQRLHAPQPSDRKCESVQRRRSWQGIPSETTTGSIVLVSPSEVGLTLDHFATSIIVIQFEFNSLGEQPS